MKDSEFYIVKTKLDLLKKYIDAQAMDEALWFEAETAPEAYLQKELRTVAWLIEEATCLDIINEIDMLKELKGS